MQTADRERLDIFQKAVSAIATGFGKPLLYGPNNKPLMPSGEYTYQRDAAKRTGSMKNWIPKRLLGRQAAASERSAIVARSVDLVNNDAHAAGAVDTFAATVIGSGLTPHPILDKDALDMTKADIRKLQKLQGDVYWRWYPQADAGERMSFGAIQYLAKRNLMQYGEYLALLHMLKDPLRPYSLAIQIINPMRLKTPVDFTDNGKIVDGVELGKFGQPAAYWIKKASPRWGLAPDTSDNFLRIKARQGHRLKVLHGFVSREPEAVRGMPFFAPAMKMMRDLNDYLNAELVSNIVTAAFSMFIETQAGANPLDMASYLAQRTETRTTPDGNSENTRYQEMIPGTIMYGSRGQRPHTIAASRPGATFDPFTKTIKKAIALALNMPYPVLFKDVEGVNFAGFRSAMLDAWRVFTMDRAWMGEGFCQPVWGMLQEEAWLRGDLPRSFDFYGDMSRATRCEWRGAPKGDIEPIKAIKADLLAIEGRIKSRTQVCAERNRDFLATADQLEDEKIALEDRDLYDEPDPAEVAKEQNTAAIAERVVDAMDDNREYE